MALNPIGGPSTWGGGTFNPCQARGVSKNRSETAGGGEDQRRQYCMHRQPSLV